jgi:threonine dehydrogenase-like Zn-dependent dehydrogenase
MEGNMKAAVLTEKCKIQIQEVPTPRPQRGQALIKVRYCGICGSDVHIFQHGLPQPNILGHEFSGIIAEVGPEVENWKVGEAVSSVPGLSCGSCYWCLHGQSQICEWALQKSYGTGVVPGAMAEYIAVQASCMRRLPKGVGLREAPLAEPLSVALHGVRLSHFRPGDRVVVLGCGTIGLLTTLVLARSGVGAMHVTDLAEGKRQRALKLGADEVHDPQGLSPFIFHQRLNNLGPDIVFECVGVPQTLTDAINYVKKGGQVLVLGVGMAPTTLLPMVWNFKEVEIKGSFGMTGDEYDLALGWLSRGWVPVDQVITKEVPLKEIQEAFNLLEGPNEEVKVLIRLAD